MAEALWLYLINFNDYFVENLYSQIWANTNAHDSVKSIITQACVLGKKIYIIKKRIILITIFFFLDANKTQMLKDIFSKTKKYPYTPSTLNYLTKKTAVFLLHHFQKVFITQGQSHLVEQKRYPLYKLVALNAIVDVKCLPTGFNTEHPPSPNNCDLCNQPLIANNFIYDGEVLICGHGYHWRWFTKLKYRCIYCKKYYKKGIISNVKSFLQWLEKGSVKLTEEDGLEEELEEKQDDEIEEVSEDVLIELVMERKLANVSNW